MSSCFGGSKGYEATRSSVFVDHTCIGEMLAECPRHVAPQAKPGEQGTKRSCKRKQPEIG